MGERGLANGNYEREGEREGEVYIPETVLLRAGTVANVFSTFFLAARGPIFVSSFTVNVRRINCDDYPRERVARRPERQTQSWPAQCLAPCNVV